MLRKIALQFACMALLGPGVWSFCSAQGLSGPSKSLWSQLAQLPQLQSIEIHKEWTGLSPLRPIVRHYTLKPEGDHFAGKALFSFRTGAFAKTKQEPIAIPNAAVRDFLRLLSRAPFEKGKYEPYIISTDDYPSVTIEIRLSAGKLSFFSQSQGEWAIPWGATLNDASYVIRSKEPAAALKLLQPYFKEDSMAKFTEEVEAQLRQGK